MTDSARWVLLAYRVPREPSTPRIAIWRRLKALGVAQLGDGLVALPLDARTSEQLEWVAESVREAGGEASVWLAAPTSSARERAISQQLRDARAAEYAAITAAARAATADARTVGKLRRELRRVGRRDFFPTPERDVAKAAVDDLSAKAASQKVVS